ncbi:MAG: TlpA family protein disulfide reductase [Prevotella sp.]|nr:TlpA family protein disulfide reductase [Prevotella sp.]
MSKLKYWNIMLACLLLWGCGSIHEEDDVVERIVVGSRVPIFSVNVVDYEGLTTSCSTNRLYGETVIVFFSTQCKDCQRELPELNDYYLKHKDDDGFQMVAISRAEGEQSVADFWSANNLQIPYSAQEDRKIYDLFASSVIPRVYFVSSSGIITKVLIENFDLE